jgi:hypothetical protein
MYKQRLTGDLQHNKKRLDEGVAPKRLNQSKSYKSLDRKTRASKIHSIYQCDSTIQDQKKRTNKR